MLFKLGLPCAQTSVLGLIQQHHLCSVTRKQTQRHAKASEYSKRHQSQCQIMGSHRGARGCTRVGQFVVGDAQRPIDSIRQPRPSLCGVSVVREMCRALVRRVPKQCACILWFWRRVVGHIVCLSVVIHRGDHKEKRGKGVAMMSFVVGHGG